MFNIELRDLIRSVVRNEFADTFGIACKVSNVVEHDVKGWVCDCSPIDESADLSEVRLQSSKDGKVLFIPTDGSIVYVMKESESQAFVSMYGSIDSIVLLGGENGGVPISANIAEKLNVLEERMIQHQHISAAPMSPTTLDPATNPPITETQPADLENENFKH